MKYKIIDNHFYLTFAYDKEIVALVKNGAEGRKYNGKKRLWTFPVTIDNCNFMLDYIFPLFKDEHKKNYIKEITDIKNGFEAGLVINQHDMFYKTKPFKHQEAGLNLVLSNNHIALHWEMGTGKTWVGINAADNLIKKGLIKTVLIVCPKTVFASWESELKTHSDLDFAIIDGTHEQRKEIFKRNDICIVNYEVMSFMQDIFYKEIEYRTKKGEIKIKLDFSIFKKPDLIILDESHFIKNYKAIRTKVVWGICTDVEYKINLTGTPITQGPGDIFSQFFALDGGKTFGTNYYSFRNKYFINVGYGYPDWQIRQGMLPIIRKKMALKSHRLLKTECLDLPEKLYQTHVLEMPPDQAKAYKEMKNKLVTILENEVITAPIILTKLMKLNQITSGFLYTDEGKVVRFKKNLKADYIEELLYDKQKAVIWCIFTEDIKFLLEKFKAFNPVWIAGGLTTKARSLAIDTFQNDPNCRLFIGNINAGGTGTNLWKGNFVSYFSQGYSAAMRWQSEDRTHRIGSVNNVLYADVVYKGTVGEKIIEVLKHRKAIADFMNDDMARVVLKSLRR